jgi:hypothetical protein
MKLPYFKLGEAFDELKSEFSFGTVIDQAKATAKLTGKTVANVGLFAVEIGVDMVKSIPDRAEKHLQENKNLTSEQRSKLETIVDKKEDFKSFLGTKGKPKEPL